MNEDSSAELSSDEQMAEEERGVIYTVIYDELWFVYRSRVKQISEVRELLEAGGTYSALIEAIDPLDGGVAHHLERLLETEEAFQELEAEGEDPLAAAETLMFDYARLDRWLEVMQEMLFDDDNSGLPEEIQKRFGQRLVGGSPLWSGERLSYPAAEEAAIVQALRELGVSATRDESAVRDCLDG